MKFHQLARTFYEWGWEIKHEHYVAFSDYLKEMVKRKRVMLIYEGTEIIAIIIFFLTHDYNTIYKKGTWDLVTDNPEGNQMYIDKMVCKAFSRELIHVIRRAVESQYPNVIMGVYHRAPKDKCVKIYCGGKHERLQSSVFG